MTEDPKPPNSKRSLTGSTFTNFLWMSGSGGVQAVLKILVVVVLARLLLPEEFGLVSAALTVVILAEVIGRVGVAPAIIQAKELTRDHIATGTTTTIVSALVIASAVYLLAIPISRLYAMPELVPFIQVFSVMFLLKGAGLVSLALLERRTQFRELALIQISSYIFGYACVATTLAFLGYGAWALVIGQIVQTAMETALFIMCSRKSLAIGFRPHIFKHQIKFGFGITLAKIANYVAQHGDYIIVGRWLGAEALGYYSRAYMLLQQPTQLVGNAADKVLFPVFSAMQEDRTRIERALNRALSLVAMVQVPLSVLFVILAPEIVFLLLGPQWYPAVLPFQILVGVLFFRTGYKLLGATLRATGHPYVLAMWQFSYAASVVAGAGIGQKYGLWAVAIGVSCAVVFCHFFALYLTWKVVGIRGIEGLRRLAKYAIIGAFASGLLLLAEAALESLGTNVVTAFVILTGLFCGSYLLMFLKFPSLFDPEGKILRDRIAAIRSKRRKPR